MKKLILLIILSIFSYSQNIELNQKWKLLGTSEKIEDVSVFNRDCLKALWSFKDDNWYIYKPNDKSSNLNSLDKEQGFWVIGKDNCKFATSDPIETTQNTQTLEFIPLQNWDELAVRKILHLFAYGSFATENQIKIWAEMNPQIAIKEILTFDFSNIKLSPPDSDKLNKYSSFEQLRDFWSKNLTDSKNIKYFDKFSGASPYVTWISAVNRRGLNPFREKIGLFETNYHMVANRDVGVYPQVIVNYYDSVVSELAKGVPYEEVLAKASVSSAIAYQYGHNRNVFEDGAFRGNEDFAREFHQLFFGILGDYDSDYHEFYSIRNTAKALTGITADWHREDEGGPDVVATYDKILHYPSSLEILKSEINGTDAQEKMFNLAKEAIKHPESLNNLPIIIIRNLADDNLNDEKIKKLQYNWQKMEVKNLLEFIQNYAISEMFHSEDRFKYYSSIDRNMLILNKMTLKNDSSYLNIYGPYWILDDEDAVPFEPIHDVFGHQSSLEASDSPTVFQFAYNKAVDKIWFYTQSYEEDVNKNVIWEKDWSKVIPKSTDEDYVVKDVAKWLWNYFIADGGKNFQTLEIAHIYSLLASGSDLSLFLDEENPLRVYKMDELQNDRLIVDKINDAGVARVELNSNDIEIKREANERIGKAIAFISATPYIFLQEGK